jgi:hypothetical protein
MDHKRPLASQADRNVLLAWIFKAELLNDICRAGFRVALASMNRTPAEKVIKIDGVWFHGHAGTVSRFTEASADLTHSE